MERDKDRFGITFQKLLDAQSDALEARSGRIRRVRRAIGAELSELAQTRLEESQVLQRDITRAQNLDSRRTEYTEKLAREEFGSVAQSLMATKQTLAEVDVEIARLEKLRTEKRAEKLDLESVLASRKSHWKELLRTLPDPQEEIPIESIETQQKLQADLERESEAARDGLALWTQVVSDLNELDADLKQVDEIVQIDQLPFMLARAISTLEAHLQTAESNGWSVLLVAIGHEIHLLRDALSAVQQHD